MAREQKTDKRESYKVRVSGWDELWTLVKEGLEVSALIAPDGRERFVPNNKFRRVLNQTPEIKRRKLSK